MYARIALLLLAAAPAATAQIVNGDFETGSLVPWVVTPTPNGGTIVSSVSMYDVDGPGPLTASQAATFMVGRLTTGTEPEGIVLSQAVPLASGAGYRFNLNCSARALVNVYNSGGGKFEMFLDGALIDWDSSGILAPGQSFHNTLTGVRPAPQTRNYTLSVRITRTVLRGEEVFQYLDNITATPACYANCDESSATPALTPNDFVCFVTAYTLELPFANCDGSTGTPLLTPNDYACFLNAYAAGCS
jgi:hypothetical protein